MLKRNHGMRNYDPFIPSIDNHHYYLWITKKEEEEEEEKVVANICVWHIKSEIEHSHTNVFRFFSMLLPNLFRTIGDTHSNEVMNIASVHY